MLRLIRTPNFVVFLTANFISGIGDFALWLAVAIWLKELTGSSAAAGFTLFAFGCGSLLAPIGGVLADRFRRRRLLIVADLVAAMTALSLTLIHHSGQAWLVYAVMFIMGLIGAVITAANTALLPHLVPGELLGEANGLQQMLTEGIRLFAPVLGAGLFTLAGAAVVARIDAGTFLIAAIALLGVKVDEPEFVRHRFRWIAEAGAGARFLAETAILRRISVALGLVVLAFGFMESINFSVVTVGLHHSASFIGVLLAVQSIGGVLGAGTAGLLLKRLSERRLVVAGLALALSTPLLLTLPDLAAALAGFGIGGIALPWVVVAATTALQRRAPAEIMGRLSSVFSTILIIPQVVSIGAGAALITLVRYQYLLIAVAGLTLLSICYLARSGETELSEESSGMFPITEFGGMLADMRRSLGLTQEALAGRSGVSVRTIRNFESGRITCPRPASVDLLAKAMELQGPSLAMFEKTAKAESAPRTRRAVDPADETADLSVPPAVQDAGRRPVTDAGTAPAEPRTGQDPAAGRTALVGRNADLASLLRIVPERRLVVLTGAAGVGKSALAAWAAPLMASDYPEGVFTADVGMLETESADWRQSMENVARAILLRMEGAECRQPDSAKALTSKLGQRRLLLLIDNAEHVARGTALLAEHLLSACPALDIIVTSRRSLSVPRACLWEVLPLPVLTAGDGLPPPAVRLFLDQAAAVCPGLDLAASLDVVTRLCDRIDGLPLAIHFTAGWLRSFPIDELTRRLTLGMLGASAGTGLTHQREVLSSIRWSLDLLTDRQRRLLTRLARFEGPFDFDAAERMMNSGGERDGGHFAEEFAALVDNSLVLVSRSDRYQYRLLRLTRDCLAQDAAGRRLHLTALWR